MSFAAVIMAGGTGSRFWPLSRKHRPKQLVSLGDRPVMLRQTLDRLGKITSPDRIFIITARDHAEGVNQVARELPEQNIFIEPEGRDTAAAAGFASRWIQRRFGDDTIMGLFPADHSIKPVDQFETALRSASEVAEEVEGLVTFGIKPEDPSTGYGYIQFKDEHRETGEHKVYRVEQFHEKPDRETAESYLEQGHFLWNSGMFVWPVTGFNRELEQHMPDLDKSLDRLFKRWDQTGDRDEVVEELYPSLPQTSVDYGILERSSNTWTIPVSFRWNDLGTWSALADEFESDSAGNINLGDVITLDTEQSILVSREDVTIATIGIRDLIVVTTEDAVLVCDRNRAQDVKQLVNQLEQRDREELL